MWTRLVHSLFVGPYAQWPGNNLSIQAMAGGMETTAEPEGPFSISFERKAVLVEIGVYRSLRVPSRFGPTIPSLATP